MKTKETLEDILNGHVQKHKMTSYLEANLNQFDDVIKYAISDKEPEGWRAAWLLGHCISKNDSRLQKYLNKMVNSISTKKDGHQRELLKILNKMELTEEHEGVLFDLCMNIWEAINKSPSVRVIAFRFIIKMVGKYPELNSEIEFLSQAHYLETLSPGIKNSILRLIKQRILKTDNYEKQYY